MFKRPFQAKAFAPMRSSDRRRLLKDLYSQYPSLNPISNPPEAEAAQEGNTEAELTNLKEQDKGAKATILPDTVLSAKASTHTGEPIVAYTDTEGKPLWVRLDVEKHGRRREKFMPTVYTLWEHPDLFPTICTHAPVVPILLGGADLMLPGVVIPAEGFPDLREGDWVSITISGHKAPLAVGMMAVDTKKLTRDRQGRLHGRCVHILHVYRDFLWKHGGKTHPPDLSEVRHMKSQGPDGVEKDDDEECTDIPTPSKVEQSEGERKEPRMPVEEVDSHLQQALLHALCVKIGSQHASSLLPISASLLYETYILPCRPPGSKADIKQSSWKKISKFLKVMDKEKLMRVKEVRGDLQVLSVNWKHKFITGFVPQETIESTGKTKGGSEKDGEAKSKAKEGGSQASAGGSNKAGQVRVEYYYKPNHPTGHLFIAQDAPKDKFYDALGVKQVLQDYLDENDLVNQRNKRLVILDLLLSDMILGKDERNGIQEMPRDTVLQRILDKMQSHYLLHLPGQDPQMRKGSATPLGVHLEKRQGRKVVTRITGLDSWGQDVDEIAKVLQVACAGSASVQQQNGAKPGVMEVQIQGDQGSKVMDLLTSRGIPGKFIRLDSKGLDKKKK
ncbi:hypothetical protein BJ684DRAFT_9268 [Piptocephalis cylindrospora]|uniref:SUI1 domain-containing protein n=1 Tax=Piptocephalis cylindrospora TaxID=1907219 RepID=A0A4P9Y4W9_9FUNG|nr:hypothetical protein BJ684DRAFT_9268 [Piptocephalis cylindrospora]|eukprot:RKP13997.1 hypothetical protein BJ684DRAFT_9268 [Piptocephalis cylindrospora]